MLLSPIGKKAMAGHAIFLFVNIIVLALSIRVNQFQDYFYVADILPFILSIVTCAFLVILIGLDLTAKSSYLGLPQSQIGEFSLLTLFWLAFNSFSTSRWRQVPFNCDSIPNDLLDEQTWCKSLQALKSFVWVNFVICLSIALLTLRYTLSQYNRGNSHIFRMPLSQYYPELRSDVLNWSGGSEFLQFEKVSGLERVN